MNKILRKRTLEFDQDLIFGKRNLSFLIEQFQSLIDKYEAQGFKNISLETKYFGYDGGVELNLIGYNLETDEEFEKRIEQEKAKRIREENKLRRKEQREKQKLEQLRRKFDNSPT